MPRAEKRGAFNIDNYYSSTSPIANQFIPQFGFIIPMVLHKLPAWNCA